MYHSHWKHLLRKDWRRKLRRGIHDPPSSDPNLDESRSLEPRSTASTPRSAASLVSPFTPSRWSARSRSAPTRSSVMAFSGLVSSTPPRSVKLRRRPDLREALLACDLMLADGMAVVWASRLLGRPLPERVAGIDLFTSLLAAAGERGESVFILGAKQEVLDRVLEIIQERYPGVPWRAPVMVTFLTRTNPASQSRSVRQVRTISSWV